jgi:hypothetical protein
MLHLEENKMLTNKERIMNLMTLILSSLPNNEIPGAILTLTKRIGPNVPGMLDETRISILIAILFTLATTKDLHSIPDTNYETVN